MTKSHGRTLAACLLLFALTAPASALPSSPRRFVDFLDVRCYSISDPAPNVPLRLDHLNPVLVAKGLQPENVVLQAPQQLCVPVAKNGNTPPSDTLPFIRFVDWKCYGITGTPLNVSLQLTQLNPVIAGLFGSSTSVTLQEPQLLCVPVAKNNTVIPSDVLQLIQYLDVKCYRVTAPSVPVKNVTLSHLNPLLTQPSEVSMVGPTPTQLCVPVMKNQQMPPTTVIQYIQYSDVLCYPATGASLGMNLTLTHLDPVLIAMGLRAENVFVSNSLKLCVPVAKNGMLPPGAP